MGAELDVSLLPVPIWSFFFLLLHAADYTGCWRRWSLQGGWHSLPGNQASGKLGGGNLNGLLEIIPKLSMNYPPELRYSGGPVQEEGQCWTKDA